MGSLESRLEALEAAFVGARGARGADALARLLFRGAYGRLSIVEMHVLDELSEAYAARPGLSAAVVWHELTEAQREMRYRWRRAVRDAARELRTSDELDHEEKESLKEFVREVGNYPFLEEGADGGLT